ncbi:MAG: YnfA family protein [Gemmatimonadota bacterium]
MVSFAWYLLAAFFEIAGCYGLWLWLRLDRNPAWILPALVSLFLFGLVLTRVDAAFAGRAYAAYGGVYIVSALAWLGLVERTRPLPSDLLGVLLCLVGAALILLGPRWHRA